MVVSRAEWITLYVEPSRFEFTSEAPGQLDTAYAVDVPRTGLRLS